MSNGMKMTVRILLLVMMLTLCYNGGGVTINAMRGEKF